MKKAMKSLQNLLNAILIVLMAAVVVWQFWNTEVFFSLLNTPLGAKHENRSKPVTPQLKQEPKTDPLVLQATQSLDQANKKKNPAFKALKMQPCPSSSAVSKKRFGVNGSSVIVRQGPGLKYAKVINAKASKTLKRTQPLVLNNTTTVHVLCRVGSWAKVRLLRRPYEGWIQANSLAPFLSKPSSTSPQKPASQSAAGKKKAPATKSSALSSAKKSTQSKLKPAQTRKSTANVSTQADGHALPASADKTVKPQRAAPKTPAKTLTPKTTAAIPIQTLIATRVDPELKKKVSANALDPYDQKGYPNLVSRFQSRLPAIEHMRALAAQRALQSGRCDRVQWSELSVLKSSLEHLFFRVDCNNGVRINFDEFELAKEPPLLAAASNGSWTEQSATDACVQSIQARAFVPTQHRIENAQARALQYFSLTQNSLLLMDFDLAMQSGQRHAFSASCYLLSDVVGTVQIGRKR